MGWDKPWGLVLFKAHFLAVENRAVELGWSSFDHKAILGLRLCVICDINEIFYIYLV